MRGELPAPAAARAASASELARVWNVDENIYVSTNLGPYSDPAAWGLIIADIARHAAAAYKLNNPNANEDGILDRIVSGLQAELQFKTQ